MRSKEVGDTQLQDMYLVMKTFTAYEEAWGYGYPAAELQNLRTGRSVKNAQKHFVVVSRKEK